MAQWLLRRCGCILLCGRLYGGYVVPGDLRTHASMLACGEKRSLEGEGDKGLQAKSRRRGVRKRDERERVKERERERERLIERDREREVKRSCGVERRF